VRPADRAPATPARDSRSRARSRRVHQLFPTRVSSPGTTGRWLRSNAHSLRVLPDERNGCGEAQTRVANLRHEQGDDPVSAGQAVAGVADPEVASSSSPGTRVTIARIYCGRKAY